MAGTRPEPAAHGAAAGGVAGLTGGPGANVIKELDAHFGLPQLCLKKFWASEAALSLAVLAYNVCVLFQRHPGWQERVSAGTLRFRTVAGLIADRQELFDELATALSLATA